MSRELKEGPAISRRVGFMISLGAVLGSLLLIWAAVEWLESVAMGGVQ